MYKYTEEEAYLLLKFFECNKKNLKVFEKENWKDGHLKMHLLATEIHRHALVLNARVLKAAINVLTSSESTKYSTREVMEVISKTQVTKDMEKYARELRKVSNEQN